MFDNISSKIKLLAKVLVYVGSVFFVICGLILVFGAEDPIGWFYVILGPILVWVSCFVLYGFGQLVENSDKMVALNSKENIKFIKEEHKEDKQVTKQAGSTTANKVKWNIKPSEYSQYEKVQEIVKDITQVQLNNLKQQYKNWYISIQNIPDKKLFNIVNNERDAWEKEYIELCCIVLLERVNEK